ncbi:carbon monoxide dehydrogenase [Bacillus sp. AFS006103]|nr:carbon monoxide dehydrogenase [Bacillus sp. AFS006103]
MKIEYDYTFGLPMNVVWKYIKDENVLRNSLPGCKSFMETSKDVYQAQLEVNMGPIQDLFSVKIRLNEMQSSSLIHLQVKGAGNIGEIVGNADLFIKDIKGTTKLNCTAEAQVTGALALAGQRVIEGGANKGMESFFQTLEKEIKRKLYMQRRGR